MRLGLHRIIWLSLAAALPVSVLAVAASAQVICVSNTVPPPELPVYDQPALPGPGYIWTPGYWAGGPTGYFWVPGTWVLPPAEGVLWTPGYWAWRDGIYVWNAGYWGPHVGFYGGVNYGFGYGGEGYEGGYWDHGVFAYNRTINNLVGVNVTVRVYEKAVVEPIGPRVSFNGGSGGIVARPTPQDEAAAHEQHIAAIPEQSQHERVASANKSLLASENHGHPAIAATTKPGDFSGKGVVAAREAAPETPRGMAPAGEHPLATPSMQNRPMEREEHPGEATLNREPPAKPLTEPGNEAKPLTPERQETMRPSGVESPPRNTELREESKPATNETRPSNGPATPPHEANLPNTEKKPPPAPTPPKLGPQPRVAGPPAHPPAAPPSHPPPPADNKKKPPQ